MSDIQPWAQVAAGVLANRRKGVCLVDWYELSQTTHGKLLDSVELVDEFARLMWLTAFGDRPPLRAVIIFEPDFALPLPEESNRE